MTDLQAETDDLWEKVGELRESVAESVKGLHIIVAKLCGDHHPTSHRDRQPPWCKNCGRDNDGVIRRKTPA